VIEVLALAVALLVAVGVHLLLGRSLFRAILGFSLLAHAANLIVLAAGGEGPAAPVLSGAGTPGETADPLPQALVLTAIVISMAVTLYLIGLLQASARGVGSVEVEPALAGDEDRDPAAVAAELRGEGEDR
jgi:multicomponent Na+:H+ antiporter subunit C